MTRVVVAEMAHGSIAYEAAVALRQRVLREPLGLRFTREELDRERSDFHLGCYDNDDLVGCLVLVPRGDGEIQMRQVAIAKHAQGQGLGRTLVEFAEEFARRRGFISMVLHARETAAPFYEKLGYSRWGESFLEILLPHWRMQKDL